MRVVRNFADNMPADLVSAKKLVYSPLAYDLTQFMDEPESKEYGACTFNLNARRVKFRVAKITPTKTGQFVTLWKRDQAGITQPHDIGDAIDFFIISVRKNNLLGQFIFPKSVLLEQGILSTEKKEGKRGFRVYPPWDLATNKQAQKTQSWQLNFFQEINDGKLLDKDRWNSLFSLQL